METGFSLLSVQLLGSGSSNRVVPSFSCLWEHLPCPQCPYGRCICYASKQKAPFCMASLADPMAWNEVAFQHPWGHVNLLSFLIFALICLVVREEVTGNMIFFWLRETAYSTYRPASDACCMFASVRSLTVHNIVPSFFFKDNFTDDWILQTYTWKSQSTFAVFCLNS